MRLTFITYLGLLLLSAMSDNVSAYDDQITHRKITERAMEAASIEEYLIQNLGFPAGLTTTFPGNSGNSIMYLLMEGSKLEDHPMCRASNHFHNPLLPWNLSQLNDDDGIAGWVIHKYCMSDGWLDANRKSAITWATGLITSTGQSSPRVNQRMGWDDARNYYYQSLMLSATAVRNTNFALTFESIGQVMHLLEDMAVPAHVRNDFLNSHVYTGGSNPYELFAKQPTQISLISSLTYSQIDSVTPQFARLSDFWDTTNEASAIPPQIMNQSLQASAGLAEYTNANFISEGTLFSNSTTFSYPRKVATTIINVNIPDPFNPNAVVPRPYYYKIQDWESNYFLAGVNYSYFYDPEAGSITPDIIIPPLDKKVHHDYAARLLPRAVGYSAGLLNYFFRGKLDAHLTLNGIRVINKSDEEMTVYTEPSTNESIGTIDIYYDNMQNERKLLANYKLAGSSTPVIPPGGMTELIRFERPIDNIAESRYILVFRGRLGNEDGAVAGRVYVPSVYYAAKQNGVDRILKVNIDATGRTVVFDNDDPNILLGRFSFSSDETKAAINILTPNDPNADLYLLDSTTGGLAYLTKGNTPVLSPDGDRIAFSYEKGSGFPSADEQLAIYDLTAGTSVDLPIQDRGSYIHPAWSPNGNSLAYSRWPGGENCRNQAAIVVLTGTTERVLACENETENFVVDTMPAWSPDGREIAFVRAQEVGLPYSLYKVNVSTGLVTRLTGPAETGYDEQFPTWSSDGATIAISSNRSGHLDVWLVGANGEGYIRNLTADNAESDGMPVFGK